MINIYSNVGGTIVMNGDAHGNSGFCTFPLGASGPLLTAKTGDGLSLTGVVVSRPSDTGITLQDCVINTP